MSIIVLPTRKPRNKDILALSNHKKFIYRSSVEIRDSIGLKIRASQIKNCCYNIVIFEGKEKVDVGDAIISNEKLKKKISWSPTYSFEKGMLITKNYFENCLNKYLR